MRLLSAKPTDKRPSDHRNAQPRLTWQTPLARRWLPAYFDTAPDEVPPALLQWLQQAAAGRGSVDLAAGGCKVRPLSSARGVRQPVCTLQGKTVDDDGPVMLREVSDAATFKATMLAFRLTLRESDVLHWVDKGQTKRNIGDSPGSSSATVKKPGKGSMKSRVSSRAPPRPWGPCSGCGPCLNLELRGVLLATCHAGPRPQRHGPTPHPR